MLDKRFILENAELVQQNCDARGMKADVARYVKLETDCRLLQQEVEELSRQANVVSKSIGQAISRREAEVAALIAEGKSNKEIAAELFLSELTIETHVKNILRKLGLKSRAQVAAYAAQHPQEPEAGARLLPFPGRQAA